MFRLILTHGETEELEITVAAKGLCILPTRQKHRNQGRGVRRNGQRHREVATGKWRCTVMKREVTDVDAASREEERRKHG